MYCKQGDSKTYQIECTGIKKSVKPIKYCKQGDSKTYQIECTVIKMM